MLYFKKKLCYYSTSCIKAKLTHISYDIPSYISTGIYIEDGNEMANQIKYNVIICPWSLAHPVLHGCTVPGTPNAESDTPLNQAGIYTDTAANDFIGNR